MENKSFFLEVLSKFSSSQNDYWLSYLTIPDNTNIKRKTLSALAANTVTFSCGSYGLNHYWFDKIRPKEGRLKGSFILRLLCSETGIISNYILCLQISLKAFYLKYNSCVLSCKILQRIPKNIPVLESTGRDYEKIHSLPNEKIFHTLYLTLA